MKYFIDSSDHVEINKWRKLLGNSFAGVTTNNSMLKNSAEIKGFVGKTKHAYKNVMIQVSNKNEVNSALTYDRKKILKVSLIEENFELIQYIESLGSRVAATTCYDIIQINQAIEMGFSYSMVYYAKNPYKGLLKDAVKLKNDTKSNIGLVAASIRSYDDVTHAIKAGIEYCTVKPSVLEQLFHNEDAEIENGKN